MLTHDGRRTTDDDGRPLTTIAHHEHFVLRWAKNQHTNEYIFFYITKTSQTQKVEMKPGSYVELAVRFLMQYYLSKEYTVRPTDKNFSPSMAKKHTLNVYCASNIYNILL